MIDGQAGQGKTGEARPEALARNRTNTREEKGDVGYNYAGVRSREISDAFTGAPEYQACAQTEQIIADDSQMQKNQRSFRSPARQKNTSMNFQVK